MSGLPRVAPSTPWCDDVAFWRDAAAVLFSKDRELAAEAESGLIPRVLGVEPGGSILDVFCGNGRHVTPLVRAGYVAVGIDHTVDYLQQAFTAALKARAPGTLAPRLFQARFDDAGVPQELAEFMDALRSRPYGLRDDGTLVGPVDGAIWLGSSSGYGGPTRDEALLGWIRRQLRPGGRVLIEGSTLEDLEESPFEAWEWFEEIGSDSSHVAAVWRLEHQLTPDSWFEGRWRRFAHGVSNEVSFRYRVYTREAWSEMLTEEGYTNIQHSNELVGLKDGENGIPQPAVMLRSEHARSWIMATNPG